MASQACTEKLDDITQRSPLPIFHADFMCFKIGIFSRSSSRKSSSYSRPMESFSDTSHLKKLLLAFSDLAIGVLLQPLFGIISAVMLKMGSTGEYNFASFCPPVLNVFSSLSFLLFFASLLNVTAVAVDRLLAISLHFNIKNL